MCNETFLVCSSNTVTYTHSQKFDFVIKTKVTWALRDTNRTHRKICQHLSNDFLIHSEKCTYHSDQNTYIDLSGVFLLVWKADASQIILSFLKDQGPSKRSAMLDRRTANVMRVSPERGCTPVATEPQIVEEMLSIFSPEISHFSVSFAPPHITNIFFLQFYLYHH